jgi:hypothetical protein
LLNSHREILIPIFQMEMYGLLNSMHHGVVGDTVQLTVMIPFIFETRLVSLHE